MLVKLGKGGRAFFDSFLSMKHHRASAKFWQCWRDFPVPGPLHSY